MKKNKDNQKGCFACRKQLRNGSIPCNSCGWLHVSCNSLKRAVDPFFHCPLCKPPRHSINTQTEQPHTRFNLLYFATGEDSVELRNTATEAVPQKLYVEHRRRNQFYWDFFLIIDEQIEQICKRVCQWKTNSVVLNKPKVGNKFKNCLDKLLCLSQTPQFNSKFFLEPQAFNSNPYHISPFKNVTKLFKKGGH